MKAKYFPLFIAVLLSVNILPSIGQSGTGTSGGDNQTSEYNVSYSIGQVTYVSAKQSGYYISQGVQHPTLTVSQETGVIPHNKELDIRVFPNPTIDMIILNINIANYTNKTFKLIDVNGKCILQNQILNEETSIDMTQFSSGYYFLYIFDKTQIISTYKVLKNK